MGTFKLLALDMDGTVLTEEKTISEQNRFWIHKALNEGIMVSFSTGRGVQNVLPYVEELGLTTPIVAVNGSEVWKSPEELVSRHLMKLEWIQKLHALAVEHDSWYWTYSVNGVFNRDHWPDDLETEQWLKFGFYTEDDSARQTILRTVQAWDLFEITNSHPFNMELNPKGISKASGLEEVCSLFNIDMSQVIAVGDSLNDLAMIQAAGLGVAMGNAQEEVKQAADLVTLDNENDGVAKVIREILFKQ